MSNSQPTNAKPVPFFKQVISFTALCLLVLQNFALISYARNAPSSVSFFDIPTDSAYTQNFDGIGTSATATLPTDFRADKPATVRTVGTYAAAGTVTSQLGGASLSTTATNGIYNFGSGTTTTGPDRAVGFLSSGSATQSGNLYAKLTNNSGGNLQGLEISYDVEKYRAGINPAGFRFELFYSLDGTTWTSAGSDFLTSFAADTGTNTGYSPAPGATVNISAKTLTAGIPASSDFYLAWNYSVSSGTTTTNAQALAIDNISIKGIPGTGSAGPAGVGASNPNSVSTNGSTLLTVAVTPGANPTSTGLTVTADLTGIGGSATQQFYDDGSHGDITAGDNTFSLNATVAGNTGGGAKSLPFTISDAQSRTGSGNISLTVQIPVGPADHIVISQIYGAGGNAVDSPIQNDYVELFNPTANPITVTGWTLQYGSATSTGNWSGKQALAGVIGPNEYYLVSLAGGSNGQPIPRVNISNTSINLSGTNGKVAIMSNGDTINGACPSASTVVDFVGYGTANCSEGATNAPAPSNTTAIFRKSDGAQDTNVNGDDFVTGTPNPRSTAPIPELGPSVLSTGTNGSSLTSAPKDASPTMTFTEPVFVDPDWFDITCVSSGQHNSATVAGNSSGRVWEITPNVSFTPGEQCTVTIKKDAIHDVDTDDSAPGTDTMAADYVWSFKVATGPSAPYPESIHLVMGNPTNAITDINQPDNYLLQRSGNAASYNRDKGTPNWVSWHLDPDWFGGLSRTDTFRPDPTVLPEWYRVTDFDYSLSGFDRGHMTPNADRNKAGSIPINQETYLMTNMVPQAPGNNQGPWADMENDLRDMTAQDGGHELFIVSGPLGVGGTGDNGFAATIANGHVTVPAATWKVVLVLPKGVLDPGQVTASAQTFAVNMPNNTNIRGTDWHIYKTTVRDIENLTGYNFFSNVPEAVQNSIENGIDGNNPPGTANETVQGTEDTPAQFTLNAVNPTQTALTATVSQPAHGSVICTGINCTYTPTANYNGQDSFTFSVSNGDKASNVSTVTLNIASVNDLPTVSSDQANATSVQYSDAIQSVTFTAADVETAAGGLTPSSTFSKDGGQAQPGLPSGLSLAPVAGSPGVWTLAGNIQEPAGSYTVNVTFTDADGGKGSAGAAFNVNKEDASVAVSAPTAILVTSGGGTSGTFTVSGRLTDAADGALGNIANAVRVTFQLTPTGSALPTYTCTASAITFPSGVPTASCDFSNIAVDVYDVTAIIGGSYYQGSNKTVLTVYDPSLGFVSGSGTISRSVNGETFTAEYSVVLKYKKDGTAQGSLVYTEHRATGDVTFASTSMGALAIVGTDAKVMGSGTVNGLGNYSFVASFNDKGEPGTNDSLGLRITDSSGNVIVDLTFDPVNLSSGNIQVH